MSPEQIQTYKKSPDFQRNEAIYILSTIDQESNKSLAETFHLQASDIEKIIELHGKYWIASYYL